jgi:hypothetical protein
VVAPAATDVWAVGYSYDAGNTQHPLIEHWDGTVWTVVPGPSLGFGGNLISIAARTASDIWAVGAFINNGGQEQPLTYHWDGTTWSNVSVTLAGFAGNLRGVAIVSSNDVWAVGSYQAAAGGASIVLIMHWNGTFWDTDPTAMFGTTSSLQSVAAVSSTDVWMVGSASDGTTFQTLTIHWDGSQLTRVASPNAGSGNNSLNGVVAWAGAAWAAGTGDGNRTLTERFGIRCVTPTPTATATPPCSTGWNVVSSPNVLTASNTLNGVVAISLADAWAVGSSSKAAHTLAMRWNGAYWIVVTTPDGGTAANELLAVTSLAANDVWAVGYATNPQAETLALHWDGVNWMRVPSPNVGTGGSRLFGVAGHAANDVWAVGSYVAPSGDEQTLIEHWNGTAWSVVASPNGDPEGSFLRSVTSIAANDAWAVGYTVHHDPPTPTATPTTFAGAPEEEQPDHGFESMLLHWDGSAWTMVPGPDLGTEESHFLLGVDAASANDVWAVGYVGDTVQQTLTLHWDGTVWSAIPSPNAGTVSDNLRSVTVVGPNDIWAAGSYLNGSGVKQTLLLHWDGTAWHVVTPPNVNSGNNAFYGISASAANNIWAAGFSSGTTGPTQTLTERYNGPCAGASPTATVTPTATVCAITFADVPVGSTFYDYIRCLACRGIISGYPCGGPGEPCPGQYYRVGNNVTRGQTAKIVASSA